MKKIDIGCEYNIKNDISFMMEAEKINDEQFAEKTGISRVTLNNIKNNINVSPDTLDKIYSYFYANNYRLNSVKEELLKEENRNILFHGSKYGLNSIYTDGSRDNCDFGNGFYLGETYSQALSFVCDKKESSVYSFEYSLDGLKTIRFSCNLEWMLTICYFRKTLGSYDDNKLVLKALNKVKDADVIIAPIADNKMFYIMAQFVDGEINSDVALHSLSASKLGLQYIFKTQKAFNRLIPVEKYYVSSLEKHDCIKELNERSYEIDTKLKLAKREYKNGLYIEELPK